MEAVEYFENETIDKKINTNIKEVKCQSCSTNCGWDLGAQL